MERIARCHCGALRAFTTGEPQRNVLCHCLACQRRTGAPMHWGPYFAAEQVRIEGESRAYRRVADSGATMTFHFCPTCGSNLFWRNDRAPDRIGIAGGCFAGTDFPAPTEVVWETSRLPWLVQPDVTERWMWGRGHTAPPQADLEASADLSSSGTGLA